MLSLCVISDLWRFMSTQLPRGNCCILTLSHHPVSAIVLSASSTSLLICLSLSTSCQCHHNTYVKHAFLLSVLALSSSVLYIFFHLRLFSAMIFFMDKILGSDLLCLLVCNFQFFKLWFSGYVHLMKLAKSFVAFDQYLVGRADNGSHFVTRDPCDPSFS